MTSKEFKTALTEFKCYLKPALFTVLSENADVFSDETKLEIIEKLIEADDQMKELNDCQEKRNGIMRKGLEKIEEIYTNVKARFQAASVSEKEDEAIEADNLISNL